MAATANLSPDDAPVNGLADPFAASSTYAPRYASLDIDSFTSHSTSSPSQAKRALEAHLKDTDRRIQNASRLGTTLIQQRKDLAARLQEVEGVQQDDEVPDDLRKKLADLEKEYNEVGKESARAFLPRSKVGTAAPAETPSALTGSGRESPTKGVTAPSRRQRNQPSSRVHDIEFATEISTSLLAQVRQLQAALSAKDEELKDATAAKAQLQDEHAGLAQRVKHLDDNEQRYKDENWNLETRLQELEASHKEATEREQRVTQSLKATQSEKAAAQRDLDDLKVSHEKLNDEHALFKRQQETDLHGLRRDAASHELEKQTMRKKIDELTSQNTELAKAASYRFAQPSATTDTEFASANEEQDRSDGTPDEAMPESPVKGTPRHGMLESETLKSSLNHAHRMIQNLKNNIHREKTEKIELKRMLQDARDELETRRSESSGVVSANVGKKRRSDLDNSKFRKPARPLGANRGSTTEIVDDEPDWEDHDGTSTPSRSVHIPGAFGGAFAGAAGAAALGYAASGDDTETTDVAFETATERGGTSDAFETGHESIAGEDSEELTETEGGVQRGGTIRKTSAPPMAIRHAHRQSFQSTASLSGDEDEDGINTPPQANQPPKYRLRMIRGGKRYHVSDMLLRDSPRGQSPASSAGNGTPRVAGQSLGDELDAMDDESLEGTPSRFADSTTATPEAQRSLAPETPAPAVLAGDENASPGATLAPQLGEERNPSQESAIHIPKPSYADAGVMTEPWEPEPASAAQGSSLVEKAAEVAGGALAGFGLGRIIRPSDEQEGAEEGAGADRDVAGGAESNSLELPAFAQSQILSQDTEPVTPPRPKTPELKSIPAPVFAQSQVLSQDTVPVTPPRAEPTMSRSIKSPTLGHSQILSQDTQPVSPARDEDLDKRITAIPIGDQVAQLREPEEWDFSSVMAQDTEPIAPSTTALADRSLGLVDTDNAPLIEQKSKADDVAESDLSKTGIGFFGTPAPTGKRTVLGEVSPNTVQRDVKNENERDSAGLMPLVIKKPMADEGSQTLFSGQDIENMLRSRSRSASASATAAAAAVAAAAGVATAGGAAITAADLDTTQRPSTAGESNGVRRSLDEAASLKTPRRPASAGSMRNKVAEGTAPPLPEDRAQKIAAAQKVPGVATVGTMGPPLMPASAYKQKQPKTPLETGRTMPRDGTTPRARQVQSPTNTQGSRRTSISSFASEVDERFNGRTQFMYPDGVMPSTDPRMIQAITQTMIGEYLWKYTRKAGRSDTSNSRHRRFFWVHPYTRTLYWSEKDPSTAGRDMLKAKSVAIDTVRVISDDNAYPPGLHRKSLVVVTPGREVVFTAPTGQRHETWFNALSYLLLRTESEKAEADDEINQDDIDEFRGGFGSSIRRSISKVTGQSQSRVSLSSYNSRTTRNSSPQRGGGGQARASGTVARSMPPPSPSPALNETTSSRISTVRGSNAARFSSITSKFSQRGSSNSARGRVSATSSRGRQAGSEIYEASVAADSAEDLRAVIERQEHEADRLENVRACCDGKHDVGSLSRTSRHSSLGHRFVVPTHSHAHPPPRSETIQESPRP